VQGYTQFEYMLSSLNAVMILAIPVLAMRSLSEDRRTRVDQLLYSLPMSLSSVVVGKYLAMLAVFAIPCGVMAIYPVVLSFFGTINFATAYCSLIGFFLLGAALLALCMFLSALTESQIIAAVTGVAAMLILYLIDLIASIVPTTAIASYLALMVLAALVCLLLWLLTKNVTLSLVVAAVAMGVMTVVYLISSALFEGLFYDILTAASLFGRFSAFEYGILDLGSLIYNVSFVAFFLYLTYQAMEKRRWS
jgi:ABC-2 type transport system permease protein